MANKKIDKMRSDLVYELLNQAILGLLQKLKQVSCEQCGARAASAQDYSNVIKFLSANGFTIEPDKANDAIDKLLAQMEEFGEFPDTTQPS
jgi:hypothetical protein